MLITAPEDSKHPLLHHRDFRLFWCAQVASGFAYQVLSVAVDWQTYALTHSTFDLGMIGLVQFVPSLHRARLRTGAMAGAGVSR
ncbi:MAG: hypothetical protein ACRESI_01080 [Gammaproteobacteria bacterium]